MKEQDSLFERLYNRIVFCGSLYKGTKISKPNEFDLNIILNLSKCTVHPDDIYVRIILIQFVIIISILSNIHYVMRLYMHFYSLALVNQGLSKLE